MENITAAWPELILNEENRFRSLKMMVKEQGSLTGAGEQLVEDIREIGTQVADLLNSGTVSPSSRERQADLASRTAQLSGDVGTVYALALPLPNELSENQSHGWETSQSLQSEIIGGVGQAPGISQIVKAAGQLAAQTGVRKPLIDPGYFQDYKGTEPREFSFSWDLVPDNAEEANTIFDILYNLKKFTLPSSTVDGLVLRSPFMFNLEIGNPRINALMNMNSVVCKSMNITYGADGGLQFFADGTPKYIKLEMSFAERATVTSNFY